MKPTRDVIAPRIKILMMLIAIVGVKIMSKNPASITSTAINLCVLFCLKGVSTIYSDITSGL